MSARVRGVTVVLVVLLVALQNKVWFSDVGYFAAERLAAEVGEQRNRAELMGRRNEILTTEVLALQQGAEALEGRARTDLGMIKKDETFYLVADSP